MDEAPLNMWMKEKYIAEAEAQDADVWIQLTAAGPGNPADGTGGIFFSFFLPLFNIFTLLGGCLSLLACIQLAGFTLRSDPSREDVGNSPNRQHFWKISRLTITAHTLLPTSPDGRARHVSVTWFYDTRWLHSEHTETALESPSHLLWSSCWDEPLSSQKGKFHVITC